MAAAKKIEEALGLIKEAEKRLSYFTVLNTKHNSIFQVLSDFIAMNFIVSV